MNRLIGCGNEGKLRNHMPVSKRMGANLVVIYGITIIAPSQKAHVLQEILFGWFFYETKFHKAFFDCPSCHEWKIGFQILLANITHTSRMKSKNNTSFIILAVTYKIFSNVLGCFSLCFHNIGTGKAYTCYIAVGLMFT